MLIFTWRCSISGCKYVYESEDIEQAKVISEAHLQGHPPAQNLSVHENAAIFSTQVIHGDIQGLREIGRDKRLERTNIRLPTAMIQEVDRVIEAHPEMAYTRQQFVETAIREKLERIKLLERPRRS
jgi:hypothetical protein